MIGGEKGDMLWWLYTHRLIHIKQYENLPAKDMIGGEKRDV